MLRRSTVLFGLGLFLSVLPLPSVSFRTESVGAVEALTTPTPMSAAELAAAEQSIGRPLDADRVVAAESGLSPFTAIGFTFDAQPTGPVLVRVRDASGAFGRWNELEAQDAEGPDPSSHEAGRSGTEPLWVRSATGYEVSLPAGVRGAEVGIVRDQLRRTVTSTTAVADAAVTPPFGIGLRSSWGARPPKDTGYGTTVKLAVVHHSDSPNSYSPADVPGILRSIQAYHMDTRGWSDIAYNFVVDKFGGVWEGRAGGIDRSVIGAHAQGFNTNTVGVMVIGDYTQTTPTAAALESVARVIGWKMALFASNPSSTVAYTSGGSPKFPAGQVVYLPGVVGHQDVGLTDCPGSIEASLNQIRSRAQEWTTWIRATSTPVGSLDSLEGGTASVTASGWAKDLSSEVPPNVRLTVGATSRTVTANLPRPDVAAVYPTYGATTGFAATASGVPPGEQMACVTIEDVDGGGSSNLGCRRVLVGDPTGLSPTGSITRLDGMPGGFRVAGTSADADGPAPRIVTVYSDGAPVGSVLTDGTGRFDLTAVAILAGRHEVCAAVANGGGGQDVVADCAFVDVLGANPKGNVDAFVHDGRYVGLSGWALDPESNGPITVEVLMDGRAVTRTTTGRPRPDVASAFGMGANSGWGAELWALPDGSHSICAVAKTVGGGTDQSIGCRQVVVK